MCDHHHSHHVTPRFGSCLEHGDAHSEDHARWSRRDFMTTLGLAAGSTMMVAGTPLRALGQTSLLNRLRTLETDRVLVLIQLSGGNDGLNTVIPVENDVYFNSRPSLAIPKNTALSIADGVGFHPSFDALTPLYNEGNMAVLQNVGYPTPSLSHFRSTDIWLSASNSEDVIETGWAGRYLDVEFPNANEEPLDFPLAVQVGGLSSMLFQGPSSNLGMSLASPEIFERLAQEGILYSVEGLPDTTYGDEMRFVRTVANNSFTYAEAVQSASEIGTNSVEYPNNPLANNLSIVARLIKGQLGARIYHVSLGGFDTHSQQAQQHALLLRYIAETVTAFISDLESASMDEEVLIMTFSEFGRRVGQNGSNGTDHGTAAPLFLFGPGVEGGLYGTIPDLEDLDNTGNLKHDVDFRQVYATALKDWFGLTDAEITSVLGASYSSLGFVSNPSGGDPTFTEEPLPNSFALEPNYPNPFNPQTTITYSLHAAQSVTLRIFDVQGRLVQTLFSGAQPAGSYSVVFDAGHLPSGTYYYRLETQHGSQTRHMTLVR